MNTSSMMESPTDIFSCTRLLQSGLRVSTPPQLCPGRTTTGSAAGRFSSWDENSSPLLHQPPPHRSPSTYTLVVRQRNLMLEESAFSPEPTFRFLPPSGFAPKRTDSPRRCLKFSCNTLSNDSGISEDGWSELPTVSDEDDSIPLPESLDSLLSASLSTPKGRKRKSCDVSPGAKRSRPLSDLASRENRTAGNGGGVGGRFLQGSTSAGCGGTPGKQLTCTSSPARKKQPPLTTVKLQKQEAGQQSESAKKGTLFQYGFTKNKPASTTATSDSEIKMAIQRSTKEELIGDMTRPHALPLLSPGKHVDLKSISCETLARLIGGEYDDRIASFKIIDCRYPYEYEGGHIRGARNLYTCEDIRQELLKAAPASEPTEDGKRNILIFHCEFSSERGPFLSRFLRQEDRQSHTYPSLAYPELYLLHGGYSSFFKSHKELCEPQSYRQMQDPAHSSELRLFKAKSKSWAPGSHRKLAIRSLSRLGF